METRGVAGQRSLLPFNLESRAWVDSECGLRFDMGKFFQLTPRFALFREARYDTHDLWEGQGALLYLVQKNPSLMALWHSDCGFGGGVRTRF